jgi:hypothetical protein
MNASAGKRIIVALWFAVAGFIPAVVAFITFSEFTISSYILFLALPITFAGISGYTIGYSIVEEEKVKTDYQAMLKGFIVSVVSYLLLAFSFIIVVAITSSADLTGSPTEFKEWLFYGLLIIAGLLILFPMFYFGHFLLLLASGTIAGWLLFASRTNIKKMLFIGSLIIIPTGLYLVWSLPNPNKLPIYPKAEDIQYGKFYSADSGTAEEKVISFQTSDSLDNVLDYYEQQLTKEGWRYPFRSDTTLEVFSPSKNYGVHISSEEGRMKVRLWHFTLLSFP